MKKKRNKLIISQLEKLLSYQDYVLKPLENLLTKKRLFLIKQLPDKENLINLISYRCVQMFRLFLKEKTLQKSITSILVFLPENNMTTLKDKLNSLNLKNLNIILHINLFQILVQELISKDKGLIPFWTPVCKTISEKLLLPIKTDCHDLDLTSSNLLLKKQVEKLPLLMMNKIKAQNKNLQKTYYQLSTSTLVDKWEKENIPNLKANKIKIKLNKEQLIIIKEWFNTCNYLYNKANEYVKYKKHKPNFMSLRDLLITNNTKKKNKEYIILDNEIKELHNQKKQIEKELNKNKDNELIKTKNYYIDLIKEKNKIKREKAKEMKSEKNDIINEWELKTPKEIRAYAIDELCNAYKTAFGNLKNKNILTFDIEFRKKKDCKSITIPKNFIKLKDNKMFLAPTFLGKNKEIKFYNKNKNLKIDNDCKIKKINNNYYLIIPIQIKEEKQNLNTENYCGIDPGVRTFMTLFNNDKIVEYKHNHDLIKLLNKRIDELKKRRRRKNKRNLLNKIEKKKKNLVDEIHWKTINDIISFNDVIFYGNINSHDIVKNSNNTYLNRDINDLKFYLFKERLIFKSLIKNKYVILVNEAFTSKTCSSCGSIYNIGSSKTYNCSNCKTTMDRDINAAKNILIKGIINI